MNTNCGEVSRLLKLDAYKSVSSRVAFLPLWESEFFNLTLNTQYAILNLKTA